ncbi:sigma-70 family RNA polymerase sigma factor [Kribbella monticola]|uniref:sigma-70 family RNA polymerase sigma factor n=1 Tax=Kribbella monticola TaxID=2185285 RepID=UPI000DD47452|nr:sigma-70 family RNA polymerase sigma factor [Kribbella monticola]
MSEAELLVRARGGDELAFGELVDGYRKELSAHCYRMLGSLHDAEDALQESLLSAWRGLKSFEGRSSLRTWLYRICTNACIRLGSQRPKKLLTTDQFPSRDQTADLGEPILEPMWLEPCPDDPAASYLQREGVELAFVAALQHLPSAQRAVLILREVLEYSAAEVAEILETTPQSVNSALQRARKAVEERVPPVSQQAELAALGEERLKELVESFVSAWERADVDAITELLAEDVRMSMPPLPAWFDGRAAVLRFFGERVFETPWRLVPLRANGQPGFACYMQDPADGVFRLGAINLLHLRDGRISWISGFLDPALHRRFDVPETFSAGTD